MSLRIAHYDLAVEVELPPTNYPAMAPGKIHVTAATPAAG